MDKMLIVDDSEVCRKPFREVAQDADGVPYLEIAEAETGEDGLAYFKEHLDIVYAIVDVHLPGINGFAMLKRMNEFDPERFRELRIFMTCTESCHHEDGHGGDHGDDHGDDHGHDHGDDHVHAHGHNPEEGEVTAALDISTSWLVKPIDVQNFTEFLAKDYKKRRPLSST